MGDGIGGMKRGGDGMVHKEFQKGCDALSKK